MKEIIASTYEIIKKIGTGGGGVIYLANHLRLEKKVILKADKRKITTRPDLLRREVDILKELSHRYIPQVYDYFIEDEIVYTVIDYIEGESLDKSLKRGERFSQAQVIAWAKQILEALDYLHSPIHGSPPRGYVHSDIKPANIMRRPNNDICLIDFNIALALGEENAVGCSRGYASPEHYGLDFSSNSSIPENEEGDSGTEILPESRNQKNRQIGFSSGSSLRASAGRKVIPDVRSDIYSLGATLYHLLSGKRPAQNAKEVIPLSLKEFSPQIVEIISKAMNPNPDLRYQTAEEMLKAFRQLHKNDIRFVRWRRRNRVIYSVLTILLLTGAAFSFIGLKRMQTTEKWIGLTEDAENLLEEGNRIQALQNMTQIYEESGQVLAPEPAARSQEVLTEILGVYDTADDFQLYRTTELPSVPLMLQTASDGSTAACICSGSLEIIDLDTAEIIESLPAENSALAEVEYLDNDVIVYAGQDAVAAYDIQKHKMLWTGEPATGISISEDKSTVATIYKDNSYAVLYDAATGKLKQKVEFGDRHQSIKANGVFINPSDNLFCLNENGSRLALSFDGEGLVIINLEAGNIETEILDGTVQYDHYEGGFFHQYLAFSATGQDTKESAFAIIDTDTMEQMGGFSSEGYYFTSTDKNGIIVGVDDNLVQIDPKSGNQFPLAELSENIDSYCRDEGFTITASGGKVFVFDQRTNEIGTFERNVSCDFLSVKGETAVLGSLNSPIVWILKYEKHPETVIAAYDSMYSHDEARLSADGKTIMLFSYNEFRIIDTEGNVIAEVEIPDADSVYDQQFIREGKESYLEVIYRNGSVCRYDASDGSVFAEKQIDPPDPSLHEVFETEKLRIESPLHGAPEIYDKSSGELLGELPDEGYLTYIIESGKYIVAQYMSTDSQYYGYLMNQKCEILAYLPDLCDVLPDGLLFDYPTGSIRRTPIYELSELLNIAHSNLKEERNSEN